MDELTPQELNKYLSEFLTTVGKKEGNAEYEPRCARSFVLRNLSIKIVRTHPP